MPPGRKVGLLSARRQAWAGIAARNEGEGGDREALLIKESAQCRPISATRVVRSSPRGESDRCAELKFSLQPTASMFLLDR